MADELAPPPKNLHHALQDPGAHELGSSSLYDWVAQLLIVSTYRILRERRAFL
jgi:hypothetical protein